MTLELTDTVLVTEALAKYGCSFHDSADRSYPTLAAARQTAQKGCQICQILTEIPVTFTPHIK